MFSYSFSFRLYSIYILVFLIPFKIYSQEQYLRNYSIDEGLAGSRVFDLAQDKEGFLWFCTTNGVSRFNGSSFQNFYNFNGFPSHGAVFSKKDSSGRLWFITFHDRACYYQNFNFYNFETPYYVSNIIPDQYGYNWFLSTNGHVLKYKGDSLIKDIRVCTKKLYAGAVIADDIIVVYSDHCKYTLIDHGKIKHTDLPESRVYTRFFSLNNQTVMTREEGIYAISKSSFKKIYSITSSSVLEGEIVNMYDDGKDLWVCSSKGLYCFEDKIINDTHCKLFLSNTHTTNIIKDKDGNYWISTFNQGVYTFRSRKVTNFFLENKGDIPIAITGYDLNNLYTFYENGKIKKVNFHLNQFSLRYIRNIGARPLIIIRDFNSGYAIKTITGQGLLFKDNKLKRNDYKYFGTIAEGNHSFYITDYSQFFEISNGKILSLNRKYPSSYTIKKMAITQNKSIWVGNEFGLVQIKNNKLEKVFSDSLITSQYVSDMKIDKEENIWISTRGYGVYCIKNKQLRIFNRLNGLGAVNCNSLYIDETNNIWITSQEGLYKLSSFGEKYRIYSFNYKNLLPTKEIISVFKLKNFVFVASKKGINIFDETQVVHASSAPPVFITSISVNNKERLPEKKINLNYDQNAIKIDFMSIDYSRNEQPSFLYCLQGDSVWIETQQTSVQFLKLKPGDYIFQVLAKTQTGEISKEPATVFFYIRSPFWQTWWFYTLLSVLFLGIVVWMMFYFKRKDLKERKYLESELVALRSQMNPHFIFNALNSIQDFILNNDKEKANYYLVKFATLMRVILENSKQQFITLEAELRFLDLYLEIEAFRFNHNFKYSIKIDEEIDMNYTEIPSMIFQPFIENAINHGLSRKKNGLLSISIHHRFEGIQCIIEDNGMGRQKHKQNNYAPMGITTTENRLKLLDKKNNFIRITDLKDSDDRSIGTKVEVFVKTKINFS